MADSRCFVQFPHPQREHGPRDGRAWHRRNQSHMRKFMQLRGQWKEDVHGERQTGDLHAWGEWEPESDLIAQLSPPPSGSPYPRDLWPRYLWRPYYVPKDSYEGLHNTDPFIFGPRFLYSNCFQSPRPGLKRLDKGSVIAFGSGKKIDGEWRWMLDTVFVVRDYKKYRASRALDDLRGWAPATFLDVTGGPLCADATGDSSCAPLSEEQLRLYVGATPDDPVDGMFSFFPASPARDDAGFPRPLIDLPAAYFNPRFFRGPSGFRRPRTPGELRDLWTKLVRQVRDAGLVLGTYAELPERR